MGDLDRIPLYNNYQHNIKQTSNEKKKIFIRRLLVDPIPNSPNKHHKNYMADSKENY